MVSDHSSTTPLLKRAIFPPAKQITQLDSNPCTGVILEDRAEEVPREHRSFGRLKLEEEYEETTNFSIDGPGGERIETVSMRYYYPTPETSMPRSDLEEYMGRCKLYTNRGRSCRILNIKHKRRSVDTKVTAAQGTVITGLYAAENSDEYREISAMGVITEEAMEVDEP